MTEDVLKAMISINQDTTMQLISYKMRIEKLIDDSKFKQIYLEQELAAKQKPAKKTRKKRK